MEFPNFVAGYRGQNLERQLALLKWIRKVKAKGKIALPLVNRKAERRAKIRASHVMTAKVKRVKTLKGVTRGRDNMKINHLFQHHQLLSKQ